jgi:hypothetical protein
MGKMLLYSLMFGFMCIMILFIALDKSFTGTLFPNTITELNETNTSFSQNTKGTIQVLSNGWAYIPLFLFIALIYAGITSAQD